MKVLNVINRCIDLQTKALSTLAEKTGSEYLAAAAVCGFYSKYLWQELLREKRFTKEYYQVVNIIGETLEDGLQEDLKAIQNNTYVLSFKAGYKEGMKVRERMENAARQGGTTDAPLGPRL